MGLFLQKTNIIRDYREDLEDGRTWYPRDVWQNYAAALKVRNHSHRRRRRMGMHVRRPDHLVWFMRGRGGAQ